MSVGLSSSLIKSLGRRAVISAGRPLFMQLSIWLIFTLSFNLHKETAEWKPEQCFKNKAETKNVLGKVQKICIRGRL